LNYLRNNKKEEFLSNLQWEEVKVSNVNQKTIKKLVLNLLNLEISDDFFLSIESLIRLGKKPISIIRNILDNHIEKNFRTNLLNYIIKYAEMRIENNVILQLYNTDFVIRARTIMFLEENEFEKYIEFLLPLLEDPDDSVRWALIKLIRNKDLYKRINIRNKIENLLENEVNPIIREKIKQILEN
jgi:hypothetical protein